jgi:hypothetical protein
VQVNAARRFDPGAVLANFAIALVRKLGLFCSFMDCLPNLQRGWCRQLLCIFRRFRLEMRTSSVGGGQRMLTEIQLGVLSAAEIVALYFVCVMLLRAVIRGQIKWAPTYVAYGALHRLAGAWGRAGWLKPTALLTAKPSPSGGRAAQRSPQKNGRR